MRRYGESPQHEKQKERIGQILKSYGWEVEIEKPFQVLHHTSSSSSSYPYYVDVYAQNYCSLFDGRYRGNAEHGSKDDRVPQYGRRVIVEVQGRKGHASRRARQKDDLRIEDIRTGWGPIEYFEVFLGTMRSPNDIRNWADQDIAEELGL